MKRLAPVGLVLLLACASAPAEPAAPITITLEMDAASVKAIVVQTMSDGCTKRPTDDFLLAHTAFLLDACKGAVSSCVRKVCIKLGAEDSPEEPDTP